VEHKLRAYTWNVVHRYEMELVLQARELALDGRMTSARFSSRRMFAREDEAGTALANDVLHEEETFRVRARFVDHEMPCLSYALEEKARLHVNARRLAEHGVTSGPWLRELRHAVLHGAPGDTPIELQWADRDGEHRATHRLGEVAAWVLDTEPGQRIGYVTDLRYTEANMQALAPLLHGADVLYIESVFLDADREHAQRKNHLTARQAGNIARRVQAKAIVPFHHSPRYEGRAAELASEARSAWSVGTNQPR
jgi:ribonuclease Z